MKTQIVYRGSAVIGLFAPQKDHNIGGVARAISCYGAKALVIQNKFHKYCTDTHRTERHIPVFQTDDLLKNIPYAHIPIAVEIVEGAKDLRNFVHPLQGYYIFGPEGGSIPNKILEHCKYTVYIPTNYCMNLAATVNVVLYDRLLKQLLNNYKPKE